MYQRVNKVFSEVRAVLLRGHLLPFPKVLWLSWESEGNLNVYKWNPTTQLHQRWSDLTYCHLCSQCSVSYNWKPDSYTDWLMPVLILNIENHQAFFPSRVYMCMCALYAYMHMCTPACRGPRRTSGTLLRILHLISLGRGLSLTLALGWWPAALLSLLPRALGLEVCARLPLVL